MHYANPPIMLRDVLPDVEEAVRVLALHAPYTPLGGWYNPGADPHARTRPMWFQNDWVHADFFAEGSELFFHHDRYIEAAKEFYDAEVVEPKSIYVNVMAAMVDGGPAHTDNPRFHGRDRTNTPMWLLRTMLWSGLFERYVIAQATAIWWMHDVEGGGLSYWADGPDQPAIEHVGAMANTALLGDNHGMFHQVGPVGPFDRGTVLVTPSAQLAPMNDDSGEWAVIDHGQAVYKAPLSKYRVSVLWKADVYTDATERADRMANPLSMDDVADIFNRDLTARRSDVRIEDFEGADLSAQLSAVYGEDRPVGAMRSVFEALA